MVDMSRVCGFAKRLHFREFSSSRIYKVNSKLASHRGPPPENPHLAHTNVPSRSEILFKLHMFYDNYILQLVTACGTELVY